MMRLLPALLLVSIVALSACSPALNWRNVALEGTPYRVLFPCKPERGSRVLPLSGQQVEVRMIGCEAAGALFALSWIELDDAQLRQDAYARWPTAMQASLRGTPPLALAFTPPAALAGDPVQRLASNGQRPEGGAVQAQGLWWAHGRQVFQAAIYADKLDAAMVDPFFSGIEAQ